MDFLPFALAILKFLNTKCLMEKTTQMRILSFQVLLKHPKRTWLMLIRDHCSNLITTFQVVVQKDDDLPSLIEVSYHLSTSVNELFMVFVHRYL